MGSWALVLALVGLVVVTGRAMRVTNAGGLLTWLFSHVLTACRAQAASATARTPAEIWLAAWVEEAVAAAGHGNRVGATPRLPTCPRRRPSQHPGDQKPYPRP